MTSGVPQSGAVQINGENPMPNEKPSIIQDYLEYTGGIPCHEIFRKWVAIWAISASLERRVWLQLSGGKLYPNLFLFLLAPPGVGKDQAIHPMLGLLRRVGEVNLSPVSMTDKGMLDAIADPTAVKEFQPEGSPSRTVYQSLNVCVPELGTLFTKHDLGFLSIVNDLYNCSGEFREKIRSRKEELIVRNPHMTLLGGTQPSFLAKLFPPESWGMGFMARIIMIYHGVPEKKSLFRGKANTDKGFYEQRLIKGLERIAKISGPMEVSPEAEELIEQWHFNESEEDRPDHPKLQHYNTRRILHLLKLCMIHAAAEDCMTITEAHFQQSLDELLAVEEVLPEIFKEMSNEGQKDIVDDAFYFVMKIYTQNKQRPVSEHRLVEFLSRRVPANQIGYIIDSMIKMKLIKEHQGGLNDTRYSAQKNKIRLFVPQALTGLDM